MSLSTVSATIQDPSGQIFANGTWQLIFKPTPNTPGLFTDGGVPFTTLFGGALDATGSFSQAGVARNDTIAPAGSRWTLIVSPNASGQAYSVDLNVNSGAFNATAIINGVITNLSINAMPIPHAYKNTEVNLPLNSGAMFFDVVRKTLKIYDPTTLVFLEFTQNSTTIPIIVPFSTTPVFDASQGNRFDITLTGNMISSTLINTFDGQIIIFDIIMDIIGNRTFVYPGNVLNGQSPDPTSNARSIQMFQKIGNNFYPISIMTVN